MATVRIHVRDRVVALVLAGLVSASCSAGGDARSTPSGFPSTSAPSSPPSPRELLLTKIDRATDGAGVELTTSTLPANPPEDWSRSAMASLGSQLLEIAERSTAPRLSAMTPRRAFSSVFAGQFPTTRDLARRSGEQLSDYDWESLFVDRFDGSDGAVSGPTYLVARWEVRAATQPATDGSSEPVLEVESRP